MKPELAKYENTNICVAVSGGRDSMALLHYMSAHAKEYDIGLSALNCDHKIRGEASARDSAFVKEWCSANGVPLLTFEWNDDCAKTETLARKWRLRCYARAIECGADAVATAHHLDDNAETVLFRLARGSSLSGLSGITDETIGDLKIIRPLISCSRAEIDGYILENNVPFVDDETNFKDGYTRNKIRHNVLPALEEAVNGAAGAIFRFSRLAADDEEYFENLIKERSLVEKTEFGAEIKFCKEAPVFRRAALKALALIKPDIKDYTADQLDRLYDLQFSANAKKFEFLGFTAYKEGDKISVAADCERLEQSVLFSEYFRVNRGIFDGQLLEITRNKPSEKEGFKILKFDLSSIPEGAEIRFMREGDRFKKFGGGTKSLGDYFTDKKIPVRLRGGIPLIAAGADILAVCGIEISDKIKITDETENTAFIASRAYTGRG